VLGNQRGCNRSHKQVTDSSRQPTRKSSDSAFPVIYTPLVKKEERSSSSERSPSIALNSTIECATKRLVTTVLHTIRAAAAAAVRVARTCRSTRGRPLHHMAVVVVCRIGANLLIADVRSIGILPQVLCAELCCRRAESINTHPPCKTRHTYTVRFLQKGVRISYITGKAGWLTCCRGREIAWLREGMEALFLLPCVSLSEDPIILNHHALELRVHHHLLLRPAFPVYIHTAPCKIVSYIRCVSYREGCVYITGNAGLGYLLLLLFGQEFPGRREKVAGLWERTRRRRVKLCENLKILLRLVLRSLPFGPRPRPRGFRRSAIAPPDQRKEMRGDERVSPPQPLLPPSNLEVSVPGNDCTRR
jgi:hypothetical protein